MGPSAAAVLGAWEAAPPMWDVRAGGCSLPVCGIGILGRYYGSGSLGPGFCAVAASTLVCMHSQAAHCAAAAGCPPLL